MPIAVTPEQLALQQSIRDWAEQANPLALVRRLEPGSPPGAGPGSPDAAGLAEAAGCWDDLASLGVFSIAVPAGAGGAGGTVTDLAAAVEQIGDALVPGPVLPTLLAGLILAPLTGLPAAQELLPALADGQEPVAVGFTGATMTGAWLPGGALRVTGEVHAVLRRGARRGCCSARTPARARRGSCSGPASPASL